jgi:hypothetical protein
MTIHLPQPVAAYIAAENAHLPEAVAACFTEEATVRDEGKTVTGSAAIRDWKRATSEKYSPTITPVSARQDADTCTVAAKVSGNFPGSPLDMRFTFTLACSRISALAITA